MRKASLLLLSVPRLASSMGRAKKRERGERVRVRDLDCTVQYCTVLAEAIQTNFTQLNVANYSNCSVRFTI